jgi:anti-sigma regulatory factor (Ser/Thr protein kinase)
MKRDQIIKIVVLLAAQEDKFQLSNVLEALGKGFASRQHVSSVLNDLVTRGSLVVAGSKRFTFYALPSKADKLIDKETRVLTNKNLTDHEVYDELISKAALAKRLNENTGGIVNFGFTEMLNNAIEHSESEQIKVELYREGRDVIFTIRDFGVGVYENVKANYKLRSDLEAIQELLKGKTTTAPKAHSGEGIFFTSKAADEFKVIILDFENVPTIGQAFADEIFRVFSARHPEIEIRTENMNENVEFMIKRAQSTGQMLT